MPLTEVETWYLGECLKGETFLYKKLAAYSGTVQDPGMKALLADLQKTCERHIDLLSKQIE